MDGASPPVLESCDATYARLRALTGRASNPLPAASIPDHFRRAAVLLLVGCHQGRPHLVLTERSASMRSHTAEICAPGGRIEPDETIEAAAVREAVEEVGIEEAAVEVTGRLDEAWSKARNHVVPVVGWYTGALAPLAPASAEVARVFLTPLAPIARPDAHRIHLQELDGRTYENDVLDAGDFDIYGLTADLVMDLLAWLTGRERDRVPQRLLELDRSLGRE